MVFLGLLYVDEAGNSGLSDTGQPNFLYGGIYINNAQWKKVHKEIGLLLENNKQLIASRVGSISFTSQINDVKGKLKFFEEFFFHATEIIRGTSLWGKLDMPERFGVLERLMDIGITNELEMCIGILNKKYLIKNLNSSTCKEKLLDYKLLIPYFFNELEKKFVEEYVLIRAQGDVHESRLISDALFNTNKFYPDEFILESKKSLMLQLADTILWVLQAYYKIDLSKSSFNQKEQLTIDLFNKLEQYEKMEIYNYAPIYL